jgi:hypothetical protein
MQTRAPRAARAASQGTFWFRATTTLVEHSLERVDDAAMDDDAAAETLQRA